MCEPVPNYTLHTGNIAQVETSSSTLLLWACFVRNMEEVWIDFVQLKLLLPAISFFCLVSHFQPHCIKQQRRPNMTKWSEVIHCMPMWSVVAFQSLVKHKEHNLFPFCQFLKAGWHAGTVGGTHCHHTAKLGPNLMVSNYHNYSFSLPILLPLLIQKSPIYIPQHPWQSCIMTILKARGFGV